MRSTERQVYFYDIAISTNKQAASPPTMREVIEVLKLCLDEDRATHSINNDTAVLTISDIRVCEEDDYAAILVRISDQMAPDVCFSNTEKKTSRIVRKEQGEGRDYAAHLIIALNEEPDSPNVYLGLLEKNIGLHRSHVVRLLQAVLREQYKADETTFQSADISGARDRQGNPKLVHFRPMLEMTGHPSENFVSELEAGTLKDIVLVHNEQEGQLGSRSWLRKQERTLKVKPQSTENVPSKVWQYLKGTLSGEAEHFEKARIKFKTADGAIETVEVDTGSGNVVHDDRYVKSRRITEIDPPLEESSETLVSHFVEQMEQHLDAHREAVSQCRQEEHI